MRGRVMPCQRGCCTQAYAFDLAFSLGRGKKTPLRGVCADPTRQLHGSPLLDIPVSGELPALAFWRAIAALGPFRPGLQLPALFGGRL